MILKNNAIFIADSHYNSSKQAIMTLLKKVQTKEIQTSQIFLMGDIFDFICGEVEHFKKTNRPLIDLINQLSLKVEIIYFEGNHDYNLKTIFPHIQIFTREQQPIYIQSNKKKIALAHGDIYTPKGYDIYCKIIRNSFLLHFLDKINFNNWLSSIIIKKLAKKKICHKIKNFDSFIQKRVISYKCDLVIEGHFHQGYQNNQYINIPSLACSFEYMLYSDNQFKFIRI